MLIPLPLGLLSGSVAFDVAHRVTGDGTWGTVATATIGAGIIGGLLAAPFGFIDWRAIPDGTRAKRIGSLHGLGNVVVLALFMVSWWLRREQPQAIETLARWRAGRPARSRSRSWGESRRAIVAFGSAGPASARDCRRAVAAF
jgi:uncharacterized membrane protein